MKSRFASEGTMMQIDPRDFVTEALAAPTSAAIVSAPPVAGAC